MKQRTITEIILHCSATWSKQDIGVRQIAEWHTMPKSKGGRGWDHIGYHYVIRRSGKVEDGCPLSVPGYHCSGHNAGSVGVCLVGGGPMGEDNNFTEEQFDSLASLIRKLRGEWPLASIHGHNEYADKACPVFSVSDFLTAYGISRYPWDTKRWPHFRPSEFSSLWGGGEMPDVWTDALDALERLREKYGHPLVIMRSEYKEEVRVLLCDIRIPQELRDRVIRLAMDAGFASARDVGDGVMVCMGGV